MLSAHGRDDDSPHRTEAARGALRRIHGVPLPPHLESLQHHTRTVGVAAAHRGPCRGGRRETHHAAHRHHHYRHHRRSEVRCHAVELVLHAMTTLAEASGGGHPAPVRLARAPTALVPHAHLACDAKIVFPA
jgi:hypothetical protein